MEHNTHILVQQRRNQEAAETFLRRVGDSYPEEPRVAVTDKLASYGPAIKQVLPRTEHRQHKGLNHRAENAHHPTRQRERAMRRFKSPEQAQTFWEPFGPIREHFCPGRHRQSARCYRATLDTRFATWREVMGVATERQRAATAAEHGLERLLRSRDPLRARQ